MFKPVPFSLTRILLIGSFVLTVTLSHTVYAQNSFGQIQANTPLNKSLNILEVKDMAFNDVMDLMMFKSGATIIVEEDVDALVTLFLSDVRVRDALRVICDLNNLAFYNDDGIIRIVSKSNFKRVTGKDFQEEIQTRVIPLLNAKPEHINSILIQTKSASGKIFFNELNNSFILLDNLEALEAMDSVIQEMDVPLETRVILLQHVQAENIITKVREKLTSNLGKVSVLKEQNALEVTDSRDKLNEIDQFIKSSDQAKERLSLKIKVIQITLDVEHIFGVDWEAIVSHYQYMKFLNRPHPERVDEEKEIESYFYGERLSIGTISDEDYPILIEALDTVGVIRDVKNEESTISMFEEIDVEIDSKDLIEDVPQSIVNDQKSKDEKIQLQITPLNLKDNTFSMRIKANLKSNFSSFENKLEVQQSQVDVQDKSTIVVGSIFKKVAMESTRKIPFLGDLPVVGFVFRSQGKRMRKTETIIFLTPKVKP